MTESSAPRSSTLRQRILLITGVGALAVVLTGFYFREDLIEGSFGTGQVAPTDVKNHGVVVGWAQKGPGRCVFRWTKEDGFEGLTHYDYPGYATAINDGGWIVGCYETSTFRRSFRDPTATFN